jgi:ankyrin repeat protein
MSDLAWAVKNGDMDQVKELVEGKGVDVNAAIDGRLPLHYASDYGQLEVLQYLISKGAKIDSPDKHGISPLLAAIWEGHTSCVMFLVEKGASKSGTAPDGSSYVEAAEKEEIKALLR